MRAGLSCAKANYRRPCSCDRCGTRQRPRSEVPCRSRDEMKSATSSPVHLCFALPYFGQASYISFNSSSVKGSLCLACSMSRPFGFFTACAGLRVIHSLLTQYSKKGFNIAMRRAPVRGLIAHEVRNSLTSEGFPLIDHDVSAGCREFLQLGEQKPGISCVRAGRDGFLKARQGNFTLTACSMVIRFGPASLDRAGSGVRCHLVPSPDALKFSDNSFCGRPFPLACSLSSKRSLKCS